MVRMSVQCLGGMDMYPGSSQLIKKEEQTSSPIGSHIVGVWF